MLGDGGVLVHEPAPLGTSYKEAMAHRNGLVQEHDAPIERDTIRSNDIAIFKPQHVFGNPINLETNLKHPIQNKKYLVDFIKLLVQNDVSLLPAGLETLQHVDHEVSISLVAPGVEGGLIWIILSRKSEGPPVDSEEVLEHKILVHHLSDLFGQLIKKISVLLLKKSHIFVHPPFVFKECLDLLFEFDINLDIIVELFDGSEEF